MRQDIEENSELQARLADLEAELAKVKVALQKEQIAHHQTRDALYLAEQRFRGLFEHSPFDMVLYAADGTPLEVSAAWEERWGSKFADIPAGYKVLEDQQLLTTGVLPELKKAFEGEPVLSPIHNFDLSLLIPGAKQRWCQSFLYPIKNQLGQVCEVVLSFNNIDELKRAEELATAQTTTLKRTLELLASGPDLDLFVNNVLREITYQLGADNANFFLIEETKAGAALVLKECLVNGEFWPVATDPRLALFRQPWLLEGLPDWNNVVERQGLVDPRLGEPPPSFWPTTFEWHLAQGHTMILFYALTVGKRPIGYLGLSYCENKMPGEDKRELGQALAHQLTLAVQLRQLARQSEQAAILKEQEKAAQERAGQLAKANEMLRRNLTILGTQPKLDSFLKTVMCELNLQLQAEVTYLFLYDETNETLNLNLTVERNKLVNWRELDDVVEVFGKPIATDASDIILRMIEERKPFIFDHVGDYETGNTASYWPGTLDWHLGRGHLWAIVVPLLLGRQFLGMLGLAFATPFEVDQEKLELAEALANQVTLALQLTRLAEREQGEATQAAIFQERNRLAREIHDTLAQNLTGIIIQLQAAGDDAPLIPPTRQAHLEAARQLAKEALTEARRSVWALRPQALDGLDLPSALTEVIGRATAVFQKDTPELVYQVAGIPYLLPAPLEEQLLRVGQEALTNALKHAEATRLEILLTFRPDGVSLSVADNGRGFEVARAGQRGFGLLGMRERASAIMAQLSVESQIGQGCRVTLVVPIKPD